MANILNWESFLRRGGAAHPPQHLTSWLPELSRFVAETKLNESPLTI